MRPEVIAALVDAGIPLLAGLYVTLLGHRIVGKRPGESMDYDLWFERYGAKFKAFGPLIFLFGLFRIAQTLMG